MNVIYLMQNESGAYPPIQTGRFERIPPNTALWPDTLPTATFYEHNGFVTLTIEDVDGVQTVTGCDPNIPAWEAWKAALAEDPLPAPEPPPTLEDLKAENKLLRAQVGVLQEQQTFLEDCLLEMADEVYA